MEMRAPHSFSCTLSRAEQPLTSLEAQNFYALKKNQCSCNIIMKILHCCHILAHVYSFKNVTVLHKVMLWRRIALVVSVMTECTGFSAPQLHPRSGCQRRVLGVCLSAR